MSHILIVDDEPAILTVLGNILTDEGHEVATARDGQSAKDAVIADDIDLIILDIRMTPMDGMEVLRWVRGERPDILVIMLTAYATVESAVEAMKLGAYHYIMKPFKMDELLAIVKRGLEFKRLKEENLTLKAQLRTEYRFENIVAESPSMKKVCDVITRVAPSDTTVLIQGESGTGKELVAKAIHSYSPRSDKNFMAVNVAALPEALLESEMFGHVKGAFTGAVGNKKGLFQVAEGGTIFLDEIGTMPLSLQAKLLRVLQEREIRPVGGNENIPVSARVLAATNTNLEDKVKAGSFREDLFYRLTVINVEVAPLRERREDLMPLFRHFIRKEIPEGMPVPEVEPEVYSAIENYSWPGNVRELENAIKHAVTFAGAGRITRADLPPRVASAIPGSSKVATGSGAGISMDPNEVTPLKNYLREREREYLGKALAAFNGDKEKTAGALGVSLATLYRKLPKE